MNPYYVVLLLLFCFSLLTSCEPKLQKTERKTIFIPLVEKQIISVDELFEEVRYISLETNNYSLLADLTNVSSHLILKNGYIYTTCSGSPLIIFDESGQWIRSIDRKGQGPGEYISIVSFDVNNNREIAVLDDVGKKRIFFYSWEGTYLAGSTYQSDQQTARFVKYLNDSLLIVLSPPGHSKGFKINILNRNTLNFINSYWPTFLRQFHVSTKNNAVEYQGKIIFFEPQNPYIYELTADSASLRYSINVGGKMPPEGFWDITDMGWAEIVGQNTGMRLRQEHLEKGYIDNIMFFSEAHKTIMLQFSGLKDVFDGTYALINKELQNSILIDKIVFDSHFVWKPRKMYSNSDGIVIIPIPADILLESGESKIRKMFPNLLEDDNPILCIAKLR